MLQNEDNMSLTQLLEGIKNITYMAVPTGEEILLCSK